jgi:hypothetical protein
MSTIPTITVKVDMATYNRVLTRANEQLAKFKPVTRLTLLKDARPMSNEAELLNRQVVIVRAPHMGLQGKIVKVVTAERINEEPKTKGHRDVFYTVETADMFFTGVTWPDILQLPRP